MKKQEVGPSLHRMWTMLKSKNLEKAVEWLNGLSGPSKTLLKDYWMRHGFGYNVQYFHLKVQ